MRGIAALVVTGLALYVVLPSITRIVGAWPRLVTLSPAWLLAALAAEVASFWCTFGLQRIVLRTSGWFAVVAAGLTGNAVTNVLPGGSAVGAAVQFRMLATAGTDTDTAVAGLTATSLLSIGGLLALPIFALPAILGGVPVSAGLSHAALLGLGAFGVYVLLGIVVMRTDRPLAMFGDAVQWLLNKIPRRRSKTEDLGARLLQQRDDVRRALGRNWLKAVLLIGGRLGFDYLSLLGALRASGSNPRPSLVLLAYAATGIIALVPLTPGGLGIVEASLGGLLVLSGVSAGRAFLATLAYRLISYWLPLVAGAVIYFFYRRRYGPVRITGRAT
ncbi:MAG TPA: flippase-like domain-containing protein [Acidimicrobiales bacterium]|nr:flippase-like domain-containing protein [Acidimicrobiales bacterium]